MVGIYVFASAGELTHCTVCLILCYLKTTIYNNFALTI